MSHTRSIRDLACSVDLKVFNAARIWKLYGTKACKGDNTTERPHRLAKLLAVPEQGVKIAPREVLRSLASMAPEKRNRDRHTRLHGHFAIDDWISQHGLDIANAGEWHGGRKWIFNTCPWNPEHTNRSAYIVEHPNGAIAAGCHHNGCAGKNWRDLRKVIEGKDESDSFSNSHGNQPLVDHKPSINTGNQDLELLTNQAVAALLHANEPPSFFRHANFAARIEQDDDCNPFVRVMDPDRMRYTLARVARWEKLKDGVAVSVMPPMPVVHDIMATPNLPLPILTHIVEAPVFGPDGTLQVEPGYHKASRTYYAPANGFVMPSVPVRPTAIDIARARDLLTKELLGDFPFTSNTELAHAVGCLILPFVRGLIRGPTPLHLIEKPTAGTGATLLTDVITYIGIGHPAPVMTEAHDEDEWRKRITAKLLTGPSVILIDNIRQWIDSSALSAAITATSWEDRRLGHSEIVRVPVRCAWIATGTNLYLTSELARRTIRIRLDAKVDQPWHRDTKKFLHPNLKAWVADHRPELISAVLTLARVWLARGRPTSPNDPVLGSFEHWSQVIGGILEGAGIDGFLENLTDFYQDSDAEGSMWRLFVAAWWKRHKADQVGVSQLLEVATALDVQIDLGTGNELSQKTRLGKLLVKMRDRQFGKLKIGSAGQKQGAQLWRLQEVAKVGVKRFSIA